MAQQEQYGDIGEEIKCLPFNRTEVGSILGGKSKNPLGPEQIIIPALAKKHAHHRV